jgi:sulfur carrier protein ThiS
MTVTVIMHGNLRRFMPGGADRASLDVPDGTTAEALLRGLGAEQDTWLVARNQVVADRGVPLLPGDVLDCFEPVAAG